jgi:HlyD family secretion protein
MRNRFVFLLTLAALGALAAGLLWNRGVASHASAAVPARGDPVSRITAPGRVEPVSEEIRVGSQLSGRLREVPVEEGERVQRGQVIAALENADYEARVAAAQAELRLKEAELRRILNGARDQERREAWAGVEEAQAVLENARAERERRLALFQSGDISRSEAERAERESNVAKSRHQAALERHALVDAGAREEDRARAEAGVALARGRLVEAQALLEKTFIRSPVSGVVLRKQRRAGESVSDKNDTPVVTLADDSRLRVRVDVDETDVARIRAGQRAYVTAAAYGDRRFLGRVIRVGQVLGRKNIRTEEPTERVDTKILEALVELDPGQRLPLGLRVDAFLDVTP